MYSFKAGCPVFLGFFCVLRCFRVFVVASYIPPLLPWLSTQYMRSFRSCSVLKTCKSFLPYLTTSFCSFSFTYNFFLYPYVVIQFWPFPFAPYGSVSITAKIFFTPRNYYHYHYLTNTVGEGELCYGRTISLSSPNLLPVVRTYVSENLSPVHLVTARSAVSSRLPTFPSSLLSLFPPVAALLASLPVTSGHVTSALLLPPSSLLAAPEVRSLPIVIRAFGGHCGAGSSLVDSGATSGTDGGSAPTGVFQLDLDAFLTSDDLHVASGRVRLAVRPAHRVLVFPSPARLDVVAGSRSGTLRAGARSSASHLNPGSGIAGGDSQVAARLVGDAVRAADGPLPGSALSADEGARAGAERQALHVLHAHLELGAPHLGAGVTFKIIFIALIVSDERMRLVLGTRTHGTATAVVFDRLAFTIVKLRAT